MDCIAEQSVMSGTWAVGGIVGPTVRMPSITAAQDVLSTKALEI
ncbi:MAG: hypothetical protein ABJN40_12100 [Sneathiella sp.]